MDDSGLFGVMDHMNSMCLFLSLQHKENRELTERLNSVEKTQALEKERQRKEIENLHRSEQEAKTKAGKLPSLLEQLTFLQNELDKTRREKNELEEQRKAYVEETQQVGPRLLV